MTVGVEVVAIVKVVVVVFAILVIDVAVIEVLVVVVVVVVVVIVVPVIVVVVVVVVIVTVSFFMRPIFSMFQFTSVAESDQTCLFRLQFFSLFTFQFVAGMEFFSPR